MFYNKTTASMAAVQAQKPLASRSRGRLKLVAMAILTLVIGVIIFGIGIAGQAFGVRKTRPLHPGDRHGGRIVITVGSIVVGGWLLIYSTVHLLHAHMLGR